MKALRSSVVIVALLVLAGCGGSSDGGPATPRSTATSAATTDVDEAAACSYLTAADRRKLAGLALDTVVAADARATGTQCRWSSDKGLIQVTSLPATAWAKTLPDVVAQLGSSKDVKTAQDRKDLARAKKLLAGAASFTASQACGAFSTLAQLDGAAKGARTTVKYIPISSAEVGITAQTCSDGVLTSLVYSEPGLIESKRYERSIKVALVAAQKRAVRAGQASND